MQDPSLAEWWAVAAELRRGGLDRIVVPEPWSPTIEELTAAGVRGVVYAHEIVSLASGQAGEFLDALADDGRRRRTPSTACRCVGAFSTAMTHRHRGDRDLGDPRSCAAWADFEQAWDRGRRCSTGRRHLTAFGADVRRTLMVDAPLAPLRTGRQPQVEDRRPLGEI